jgi:hypothetical protein
MSQPDRQDDIVRKLAELGSVAVPVEDPARAAYRRERIVRLLGSSIAAEAGRARRARAWPWLVAAAGVVLAAGGALSWSALRPRSAAVAVVEPPIAGEARSFSGVVSIRRGGEATPPQRGERFVGGEVISTAANSGVEIGIASGSARLGAGSELEVMRPSATERRLRLGVGSVDVDLPRKLEAGKHLVVETPDVDVMVVGTAFTVEVGREHGASSTHVRVQRGTVWILDGGKQRAVLAAGEDWSSAARTAVAELQTSAPVAAPARSRGGRGSNRIATASRPADSGTLAEENRLFQAGLSARNAGDNAAAADSFAQLLSRYPRSVLREQALAEHFRALERAGRASAAAVAARRYLANYPAGFAHADAERITSGLLGDR